MGRYIRSNTDFEFKYKFGSDLGYLGNAVEAGVTEIFPIVHFDDEELEDLAFMLSPNDLVEVPTDTGTFEVFKNVFMQIREYFIKKDSKSFQGNMEEANEIEYDIQKVLNAQGVQLTAGSYYTFTKEDWPTLISWINLHLSDIELTLEDLKDQKKSDTISERLESYCDEHETDLPLLAFLILQDAILNSEEEEYTVYDIDDVWMTPIVLDGEIVTADTEIGEYDDYMF